MARRMLRALSPIPSLTNFTLDWSTFKAGQQIYKKGDPRYVLDTNTPRDWISATRPTSLGGKVAAVGRSVGEVQDHYCVASFF